MVYTVVGFALCNICDYYKVHENKSQDYLDANEIVCFNFRNVCIILFI